jgi:hypothetical protein
MLAASLEVLELDAGKYGRSLLSNGVPDLCLMWFLHSKVARVCLC